jgi:hypothetical protein
MSQLNLSTEHKRNNHLSHSVSDSSLGSNNELFGDENTDLRKQSTASGGTTNGGDSQPVEKNSESPSHSKQTKFGRLFTKSTSLSFVPPPSITDLHTEVYGDRSGFLYKRNKNLFRTNWRSYFFILYGGSLFFYESFHVSTKVKSVNLTYLLLGSSPQRSFTPERMQFDRKS